MATNLVYVVRDPQDTTIGSKFRKKCIAMGLGKEAKRHAFTEKPSVRKRRKQSAARKRFLKDHTREGEPLYQIERERVRYGNA